MDAERAALAIRAIRVTYADAEQTLLAASPEAVPACQRRALALLDAISIEIEPEADAELLRLLSETRRRIVQQA